jgi:hypothetical protein
MVSGCRFRRHPLNLVQKWLGLVQLSTTAIYANAVGEEERMVTGGAETPLPTSYHPVRM